MGSCSSKPNVLIEQKAPSENAASVKTSGGSSSSSKQATATKPNSTKRVSSPTELKHSGNTTDPADASHHSTDSSVRSGKSRASSFGANYNSSSTGAGRRFSGGRNRSDGTSDVSSGDLSSAGYESGGSTSRDGGGEKKNRKKLGHSSSIIGLDSMIENRREEGGITSNVVHMEIPFGKPIEEVYDGVHTGPVLGSGISGLVRLVTHKVTGIKYAMKCLDLGLVDSKEGLQQLREEIFIMCQLDHPNIVRLEEVYESHTEIYLVQELCLGGELFDRLDEQPVSCYVCMVSTRYGLSYIRYIFGNIEAPLTRIFWIGSLPPGLSLHRGRMCQTDQTNALRCPILAFQGDHPS